MARLTLRVVGLAVAGLSRVAASSPLTADATALFQTNQAHAQARHIEQEVEASDQAGYAYERFKVGELVEGKTRSGKWVPVVITGMRPMNQWNIHVADEYPGYDLPNVPASLLRRGLNPGQADWYVDNSALQHQGKGIKYRYSKNMADKGVDYAPWGTLIVGSEEDGGWVKTADGVYLPTMVHGADVLLRKDRDTSGPVTLPISFARAAEERRLAMQPKDIVPEPLDYEVGEKVEMRTKAGEWITAQVVGNASHAHTYNVVARPNKYTVYPVSNVHASRLRKTNVPAHVPQPGESPMCQELGCMMIRVRVDMPEDALTGDATGKNRTGLNGTAHAKGGANGTSSNRTSDDDFESRVFGLNMPGKMRLEMLMRMACNKLRVEWEKCRDSATLTFNGQAVRPSDRVEELGLSGEDVVDMRLVVVKATPDPIDRLFEPDSLFDA